ncbi:MAG: DUF4198 domain-containing protein [Planctomycetota bacterium]
MAIRRWIGAAFGVVALSPLAMAHDFWMELADYRVQPGEAVAVSLFVGHDAEVKPYPRKPSHVDWFRVEGEGARRAIEGHAGMDPAGRFTLERSGVFAIGYRSTRTFIELEASKFESYLAHEGLDPIIAERARRGETEVPGREVYSRCAKAFVRVGADPAEAKDYERSLGMPLEFIPMSDPTRVSAGGRLGLRLLHRDTPLAGARVDAMHWPLAGEMPVTRIGVTDAEGRVWFELSHAGEWVIASTHMTDAPPEVDADWESLWAALTIEIE